MTIINPRWIAWLRETGGGETWEYMLWISAKWREWERLNGITAHSSKSAAQHEAFDAWLYGEVNRE